MSTWGCGSPSHCCQPAIAGGFIYADLRSELNPHLAHRLCLLTVLLCTSHCYKLSPFQAHWGGWVTLHQLSQACVLIYRSHGKWVFLPLLWSFPPTTTFTSFPTPGCWMHAAAPAFSSWLVVRDFPSPPLRHSGCPTLFATCLFCCYCLLFSFFFSFFPWVGVGLSRGLCWSGPGLSVEVPNAA
jgi:hypothetical protein